MPNLESKPAAIEAAFFDVDNTLVRGSTAFLFGKVALASGFFEGAKVWNFAYHQLMFIWRGENNRTLDSIKDRALELVAGHSSEELRALLQRVYDEEIAPRLWPETVAAVKQHLAAGREVWLVTASPQDLGQIIADNLGATGALGTIVESKDGIATGKLVGETLHGAAKRSAITKLAQERNINLGASFAYSDSRNDLPMLTSVGHPVVVNPDKTLAQHAEKAGWKIMRFKKRALKQNK